jgi:CDP-6-deoxy-D-xylo-4-hexulose-3-dehydrase
VFDADDLISLVDSALDFWLTAGRFADAFEAQFAEFVGVKYAMLTNSGSSANLLALSALTSPELAERRLQAGDEVLTVAAGFPTTVNPIVQNGLVPVFVDIGIPTYNVDVDQLEQAISPRTKAIILAHTLGNPFLATQVQALAKARGLWLIEDCCDAVGSTFAGKMVGTFGDLATVSFYPAHHITMGEGGAVLTSHPQLKRLVESFRDWGRDCWCKPGHDDTCGRRFDWGLGDLPQGYDHKYVYSHLGYNLKLTDMQAAVGLSQLRKLPSFIARRRENFQRLYQGLTSLRDQLILPEATPGSEPSWFGFPISVRPNGRYSRNELVKALERRSIATRLLFGGNLVHQPAYRKVPYRVASPSGLVNSDSVMRHTFWLGVYPGLSDEAIAYVIRVFRELYGLAQR